ncbi:MAG: GNAT family N-acetyltransferase [Sphingobium sp.]|nr:GNAT family N-acetyltransferase [Sphingobium sp.]
MNDLKVAAYDEPGEVDFTDAMAVMEKAFDSQFGEAWTVQQLRSMMGMPGSVLVIGRTGDHPVGFGLLRTIVGEAELLLLAVDPSHRGLGYGRRILDRCLMVAERSGAESVFLEVRDSNPAVHLYSKAGFSQYNRRKDYYLGSAGCRYDALSFKAVLVRN